MAWNVLARGWFMIEIAWLLMLMREIIVGLARAVTVMLEQGQLMDTLVHGLGNLIGAFPSPALPG